MFSVPNNFPRLPNTCSEGVLGCFRYFLGVQIPSHKVFGSLGFTALNILTFRLPPFVCCVKNVEHLSSLQVLDGQLLQSRHLGEIERWNRWVFMDQS